LRQKTSLAVPLNDSLPYGAGQMIWSAFLSKMNLIWDQFQLLYVFGVFELRSKKCVGFLDIYIQARMDSQCANLGYVIHNQFWKRGYAKEASAGSYPPCFQDTQVS
jgi:RimJ/RimL family protein N-acetyltransferase